MIESDSKPDFKKPLFISIAFYLVIVAIHLVSILIINNSQFTYTIDDPYIHLSLAENIIEGHYGINKNEYSSPASSIIYPVLLVPFIKGECGYLIPLLINILSSIGIIYYFWKLLSLVFGKSRLSENKNQLAIVIALIIVIIASNLVYSTFRGMEHTLQALINIIIIWGAIEFTLTNRTPINFYLAVVISPLIRYENLAISVSVLFFLFYFRNRKSLGLFLIMMTMLAGFSLFLISLGLEPLPLSVLRKSGVPENDLVSNILTQGGLTLIFTLIFLINYLRIKTNPEKEKLLSLLFSFVILVHFALGLSGRYTEYLITTSIFILIFLYRDWLIKKLESNFNKSLFIVSVVSLLLSYKQIISLFVVPFAANNIYEQQYQMHRFATEYYNKPIAVNDIGYVSYRNDNYVLDFFGLSSYESYKHWKSASNFLWMDSLAEKHNVNLCMIYENCFKEIPSNWIKVAELHLGNKQLTVSGSTVSFFIRDKKYFSVIHKQLNEFQKSLPGKTKLILF